MLFEEMVSYWKMDKYNIYSLMYEDFVFVYLFLFIENIRGKGVGNR